MALVVKTPAANAGDIREFYFWVRKIPWRRAWQPTPCLKSPWIEELASYSPWGCKESDMTEATEHACTYPARKRLRK